MSHGRPRVLKSYFLLCQLRFLLAKMRQPARQIFADFTETTFPKILDELLSEKNFLLDRNIAGTRMIVPKWEHCLEYERHHRTLVMTLAGVKLLVSERCVKKFLMLICRLAAPLLLYVFLRSTSSLPAFPTK